MFIDSGWYTVSQVLILPTETGTGLAELTVEFAEFDVPITIDTVCSTVVTTHNRVECGEAAGFLVKF